MAKLTINTWSARRYDDKISKEVAQAKGIKKEVGRYNKVLLPDDPQLKKIKTARTELRSYHYAHTLPWEWKGAQLLPGDFFMEYTKRIATLIGEFEKEIDVFCDAAYYQGAIQAAQIELKDAFNPNDYPPVTEIRNQFGATIDYDPVPSAGDFRVDVHAEEIAKLKAAWTVREKAIARNCTEHLWGKLKGLMEHAQERLDDPDNVFHDTLPQNIKDFTDILGKMNIGQDFNLDALGKEAAVIGDLDPQALRDDPQARQDAADHSQSVLDKIKNQMGAFND